MDSSLIFELVFLLTLYGTSKIKFFTTNFHLRLANRACIVTFLHFGLLTTLLNGTILKIKSGGKHGKEQLSF